MKLAPWALLAVAAMWGISFVWMKDILDQQDVYSFLTSRFLVAAAAMILLKPKVLKLFTKELVFKGLIVGMALGSGYIFQTLGLDRTTPAITGFITGLYVVVTHALTVIQLIGCALLSAIPATINGYVAPPDSQVWGVIVFTALFATAIAFVIQTWSQARISTTKVAVILTMEVVFAAVFSVMYGMEPLTLRLAVGGTMVLIAMLAIVQPRVSSSPKN